MSYIQGLKIITDNEFAEDASIGLYEVKNTSSYPESGNLVALYRMNKGAGTTLYDDMDNYDGTISGASWATGRDHFGKCLEFNGSNANVNLGDITELDTAAAVTLSFFFKQDIIDQNDIIFRKYDGALADFLINTTSGGDFRVNIDNGSNAYGYFDYSAVISAGTWYKIQIVYNGAGAANADRLKIYIDGSSQTLSFSGTIPATTADLSGNNTYLGLSANSFDGCLDNFAIWDTNLSQANVTALNALEPSPAHFRWIETTPENATTLTWLSGLIADKGLSSILEQADFRRRGNRAQISDISVAVDNTSQFFQSLINADIYLDGLRAEAWEFLDNGSDPDGDRTYSGKINHKSWKRQDYKMIIESLNRDSNLATIIDNNDTTNFPDATGDVIGKIVPPTFGYNPKAKLMRIANAETIETNDDIAGITLGATTPTGLEVFPIDSKVDSLNYWIKIAEDFTLVDLTVLQADLVNKYIMVVTAEDGPTAGTYRKITAIPDTNEGSGLIKVTIDNYLETDYAPTTWIKIIDIARQYQVDVWKCFGFINSSTGQTLTQNFELYSWDSPKYYLLPEFSFEATGSSANKITINPVFFLNNPDTINSFIIYPATTLGGATDRWGHSGLGYTDMGNGLFVDGAAYGDLICHKSNSGGENAYLDKDYDTFIEYKVQLNNFAISDLSYHLTLEFGLPSIPDDLAFNKVYFGIRLDDYFNISMVSGGAAPTGSGNAYIDYRRNLSTEVTNVVTHPSLNTGNTDGYIDNILDAYYTSNAPSTNNKNFFQPDNNTPRVFTGYSNFELSGFTNRDLYNSVNKIGLTMFAVRTSLISKYSLFENRYYIREAAFIFIKDYDISTDLYSPFKGRIFNDTWGSRKTSAALIQHPSDLIEHCLRLGNWSENQSTPPASGWGKGYADNPSINTASTAGGFDYSGLNITKSAGGCAFQGEATGDKIITRLCQEWFLGQYQNADGEESISYLPYTGDTGTSLTLADIVPGSIGEIIEPKQEDIFIEPFVRYDYDEASGKYNKTIKITNTSAETFDSSYVNGMGAAQGEDLWDKLHSYALRYRVLNEPPSELTDLKTIKNDAAAILYLSNWIEWMVKKRLPFSVPYATGRQYFITKHFGLTLPHQTNSVEKEVLIETLERDKNNNIVNMTVVFLDELDDTAYYVQDVPTTPNIKDDWQDVTSTPNVENDIQDTTG